MGICYGHMPIYRTKESEYAQKLRRFVAGATAAPGMVDVAGRQSQL